MSRPIPPMPPQEIIPFSFKKGMTMGIPHHNNDFDRPSLYHNSDKDPRTRNGIEMSSFDHHNKHRHVAPGDHEVSSSRDLDPRHQRSGTHNGGMSSMAVHVHNDSLDRSRNKIVLLQTDSGIHSDTNSNEGEVTRDCMVWGAELYVSCDIFVLSWDYWWSLIIKWQ